MQNSSHEPSDDAPALAPELQAQVEAGRKVAYLFLRNLKVIGMYRHNRNRYGEYLGATWQALCEYIQVYGGLSLKIEVTNFTIHKQPLFSDDSQIPYKFFKDGIRRIVFREGFTLEELTTFAIIALSDPDRGSEDLNSQLWRAQLPHFEYIMVEGFKIDELDDDEVQVHVDNVIDFLQRRLRTESQDSIRFARLSEEDLEVELNDIEQMRGLVVTGTTATAELKAHLQHEIVEEERHRLFPKLLNAVFQVVESGGADIESLTEMFSQLLDAMLLQEDFAIINQVALKLRVMAQRGGPQSDGAQLLTTFVTQMGEDQRLSRVGEILKYNKLAHPNEVIKYLTSTTQDAIPALLNTLETIDFAENRKILCDVLVNFARVSPELFINKLLTTDLPQVQRDMASVLDKANHPDKLKMFAQILDTKNLALKLEIMDIIARDRTGEARRLVAGLLEDEMLQVRLQAARVLPEFDREKACTDLLRLINDKHFESKSDQEKEGLYSALGSTNAPQAIAYFVQALQQKAGLFNKHKLIAVKLLALAGLAGACTIQTAKLLQDTAADQAQPPEVTTAAQMHWQHVRKQLFGSRP